MAMHEALENAVRAPFRGLASALVRRPSWKQGADRTFWALREVSFTVSRGEVLGIIGPNGAGKSVLLRILSRITSPTEGHAEVRGRTGSVLRVGAGFHPELTGRENIYMNGMILGMKRAEVDRNFGDIVAFSELDQFLDTPIKRYSSGMHVRLSFAIASHLETEIMLIDEVLAVGDEAFQEKAVRRLRMLMDRGQTALLVSHDLDLIRSLCPRTILLSDGRIQGDGDTEEVIARYLGKAREEAGP